MNMKNEDQTSKLNDYVKEMLYIEMIHQQMETLISIVTLLKSHQKKMM